MVIITCDPVVVECTFEGGGTELGENSSFTGHGGSREFGHQGLAAKRQGARQGRQARALR